MAAAAWGGFLAKLVEACTTPAPAKQTASVRAKVLGVKRVLPGGQRFLKGLIYAFNLNGFETFKIDAAAMRQAHHAADILPENGVAFPQRPPPRHAEAGLIPAKDRDRGCADGRGDMHGAGVVGHQQFAALEQCGELPGIQTTGEIDRAPSELRPAPGVP